MTPKPLPMFVPPFKLEKTRGTVYVPGAPVKLSFKLEIESVLDVPRPLKLISFPSGTMKVNCGFTDTVTVMLPLGFRFMLTVPMTVF